MPSMRDVAYQFSAERDLFRTARGEALPAEAFRAMNGRMVLSRPLADGHVECFARAELPEDPRFAPNVERQRHRDDVTALDSRIMLGCTGEHAWYAGAVAVRSYGGTSDVVHQGRGDRDQHGHVNHSTSPPWVVS